eukprot:1943428-Prorocentrum_lima.AAC.1
MEVEPEPTNEDRRPAEVPRQPPAAPTDQLEPSISPTEPFRPETYHNGPTSTPAPPIHTNTEHPQPDPFPLDEMVVDIPVPDCSLPAQGDQDPEGRRRERSPPSEEDNPARRTCQDD